MELSSDLLEFIQFLNQRRVEYLVVGGWAFSLHARPRYTKDIDILVRRSAGNAALLMEIMKDFGFGAVGVSAEDFLRPGYVIQLGFEPNRIDLLTDIVSVDFESAWTRRETFQHQGVSICVISKQDLLANKLAAGRDQDLVDAKTLQKLLQGKS